MQDFNHKFCGGATPDAWGGRGLPPPHPSSCFLTHFLYSAATGAVLLVAGPISSYTCTIRIADWQSIHHGLTFHQSNQGGSQEHKSLITNSFFNDFAFIIQFKHKGYLSSWLYLICLSFVTAILHVCNRHENVLVSTLILGSVFSDFVAFYGDISFILLSAIQVQMLQVNGFQLVAIRHLGFLNVRNVNCQFALEGQ